MACLCIIIIIFCLLKLLKYKRIHRDQKYCTHRSHQCCKTQIVIHFVLFRITSYSPNHQITIWAAIQIKGLREGPPHSFCNGNKLFRWSNSRGVIRGRIKLRKPYPLTVFCGGVVSFVGGVDFTVVM